VYPGERFNSITHLVGAVLALVGATVLVTLAAMQGGTVRILSLTVYGSTLFLLYLFSTLYHSLRGRAKAVFQMLDYHAIYLLIAGTYTPFTLLTLEPSIGWPLFSAVWALALLGILLDSLPRRGGRRILPVLIYLAMGWLVLFALDSVIAALPPVGFGWLLAGGLFYTFGVGFYAMDDRYPWSHGVWHLFVLAGSLSHYFVILLYL
jgi:hemolysin III